MAKSQKTPPGSPPLETPSQVKSGSLGGVLNAVDAVYRFLASLKLAVISLGSLAAVLAYATWFESKYGTTAVQQWVYRTKGFAILLAFLGANILCAALIRYPWKRRQTGFVVTHAGLLVLLAGSWYSMMTADEGQLYIPEGEIRDTLLRNDHPIIRVRQVDPHDSKSIAHEWELPFEPGSFAWGPGNPRPQSIFDPVLRIFGEDKHPKEVLTRANDPFQLEVNTYLPASMPVTKYETGANGTPTAQIRVMFKPPGAPAATELLQDEDQWFSTDDRLYRVVKTPGPVQIAFTYVDRPELVEDFLNPPEGPGEEGVARFRYRDQSDKERVFDWPLEGASNTSKTLPDSDLLVKYLGVVEFPAREAGLSATLGEPVVPIAQFEVSKSGGPEIKHFALASLPMFPNLVPPADPAKQGAPQKALVAINYLRPPSFDTRTSSRFGLIEVLADKAGELYYRVWGRGENGQTRGQIRSKGPVTRKKTYQAFGGTANLPMSGSFVVEDFLPSGVEKRICEPLVVAPNEMENALAACQVVFSVKNPETGEMASKELFIRRSATLEPSWETVMLPTGMYQLSLDMDRMPLGFQVKLNDFKRGFDPGTEQASRFSSDVTLVDKEQGINGKDFHIAMNEPMTHRGYTFYQSRYIRDVDPQGRETGRVQTVLQVAKNPGRDVIYLGCILICLGTFLQFYMRAGLFSDGGKRERERQQVRKSAYPGANGHAEAAEAAAKPRKSTEAEEEAIL